jgi:hypothetical protein
MIGSGLNRAGGALDANGKAGAALNVGISRPSDVIPAGLPISADDPSPGAPNALFPKPNSIGMGVCSANPDVGAVAQIDDVDPNGASIMVRSPFVVL